MRTKTSIWILGGITGVGVIVAGVLLILARGRVPRIPQPTANRNPIVAEVRLPKDGGSYPNNGTLPIVLSFSSQKPVQLVQVWLDGNLVTDAVPPAGTRTESLTLPGSVLQGDKLHTLVVTAVDADGRSTPGNVVRVKGFPPVSAEFIVTTKGGESLQSIASKFNQDVTNLMVSNTRLFRTTKIVTGAETLPPNVQVVVPLGAPASQGAPAEGATHQIRYSSDLPLPPTISSSSSGCDVGVTVQGTTQKADGYTLYRLDPDSARFVKVADLKTSGNTAPVTFHDPTAYGSPEYYVSAYNSKGETLSPLAQVDLSSPDCQSSSDLPVTDGILHLPPDITQVYMYDSVNAGEYNRFPAKQGEFLTPQDGTIDLHQLTDPLVNPNTYTTYPFNVNLDVWGWSSGQLQFLGRVSTRLDDSSLVVCNLPGESCTGDVQSNYNLTSIDVGSDSTNQVREFTWHTSIPNNPTALFQLTTFPVAAQYDANPPGLIYSQLVYGDSTNTSSTGTFKVDFANLKKAMANAILKQASPNLVINQAASPSANLWFNTQLGWSDSLYASPAYQVSHLPKIYYGRIIPMNGDQPSGPISNVVTIAYHPMGPQPTIQLINDVPPGIYTLKIVSYNPPIPPVLYWGCVDIVGIDPNSISWEGTIGQQMYQEFLNAMIYHYAYCPTPYQGEPEKPWYEQMWDAISDGVSWLAKAYESIKDAVVTLAADAINLLHIPGLQCDDTCKALLKDGLDTGLAALGIPPSLPDLNQLSEDGLNYLVSEAASQFGAPCDPDCVNALSDQFHSLKDQVQAQEVQSYGDTATAHDHGVNPLPIPSGVTVVPDPNDGWQMASLTLSISRSANSGQYTPDDLKKYNYRIQLIANAHNDWMVGKTIPVYLSLCSNDAGAWPCDERDDLVTDTLTGQLFTGAINMPDLQPGEHKDDVKMLLMPTRWWYKDHHDYSQNVWSWADDWPYLYENTQVDFSVIAYATGVQLGGPYDFTISEDDLLNYQVPYLNAQGMMNPGP